jgi:hypothetical protein
VTRAAVLLAVLLAAAGCKKDEEGAAGGASAARGPGGDQSKSIGQDEVNQGMALCRGLVDRLCKCAEKDPSVKDACDLARARPDALAMHIKYLGGSEGPISTRERLEAEAGARKVIAACVKADSALDPARCPR